MADDLNKDVQALYAWAERCETLDEMVPELYHVLRQNENALSGVTHSYRLQAIDRDFTAAFRLERGRFSELKDSDPAEVTVRGTQANLLSVFQRKLNPATGLLLGKIKVSGSKSALLALSAFL